MCSSLFELGDNRALDTVGNQEAYPIPSGHTVCSLPIQYATTVCGLPAIRDCTHANRTDSLVHLFQFDRLKVLKIGQARVD